MPIGAMSFGGEFISGGCGSLRSSPSTSFSSGSVYIDSNSAKQYAKSINDVLPSGIRLNFEDKEIQNMKTLYGIVVVNLDGECIIDIKVVGETEEEAKFEGGVYEALQRDAIKLSEVTVIVTKLGSVKVRPVKD